MLIWFIGNQTLCKLIFSKYDWWSYKWISLQIVMKTSKLRSLSVRTLIQIVRVNFLKCLHHIKYTKIGYSFVFFFFLFFFSAQNRKKPQMIIIDNVLLIASHKMMTTQPIRGKHLTKIFNIKIQWLTLKILSAVFGTAAGEYVGTMSVNSSAKLLTSNSSPIRGLKGAAIFFWARRFQLRPC